MKNTHRREETRTNTRNKMRTIVRTIMITGMRTEDNWIGSGLVFLFFAPNRHWFYLQKRGRFDWFHIDYE